MPRTHRSPALALLAATGLTLAGCAGTPAHPEQPSQRPAQAAIGVAGHREAAHAAVPAHLPAATATHLAHPHRIGDLPICSAVSANALRAIVGTAPIPPPGGSFCTMTFPTPAMTTVVSIGTSDLNDYRANNDAHGLRITGNSGHQLRTDTGGCTVSVLLTTDPLSTSDSLDVTVDRITDGRASTAKDCALSRRVATAVVAALPSG
ncbi:MAG: hypothetical protein ACRDRL_01085 [Sciscionella sp.]